METITKKYDVYNFNELDKEAKQKVLEKLYDINIDYEWYENDCIYDEIAKDYGLVIDMFQVNFDLDRGSYVAFETYNHGRKENYIKGIYIDNYKTFFKKANLNIKLKRIKQEIAEENIEIDHNHYAGSRIDNYIEDVGNITITELESLETCLRDFLEEILDQLKAQYNYATSEEAIIETIEANEYTFLKDGTIFNE